MITGAAAAWARAAAPLFIAEGAAVMIAEIGDDRGQRIVGELGERCRYADADVSQDSAVSAHGLPSRHRQLASRPETQSHNIPGRHR